MINCGFLVKKYRNPPCNSSVATSCVKYPTASSSEEGSATAPFTEGASSSTEGQLEIDESALTSSLAPNTCVVPDLSVVVQGGKKCVREYLNQLSDEESPFISQLLASEAADDDDDSFVDIMSGIAAVGDVELEG